MAVLINLLPEARLAKLRDVKRKRLATTVMIVVCVVILTIIGTLLVLMAYNATVSAANKGEITTLNEEIAKSKDMEQQAATIQEHLATFYSLNSSRLFASEIFSNFGNTIPSDVTVSSFALADDYTATISGSTSSIKQVSIFSNALEEYNVNFKPQENLDRKQLFSDVKITSVSKDNTSSKVTFSMTFKVDPSLFKTKGGKSS
jgi:Tfp pilus assembly protein PilN